MPIQVIPLRDYTTDEIISHVYIGKRPEPAPSLDTKTLKDYVSSVHIRAREDKQKPPENYNRNYNPPPKFLHHL